MANVDNVNVKVVTTDDGDRIGLVFDEGSREVLGSLRLNSLQELELIKAMKDDIEEYKEYEDEDIDPCSRGCNGDCCKSHFENYDEFDETKGLGGGNYTGWKITDFFDNRKKSGMGEEEKNLKKTIDDLVGTGIKQAQEIGKFMKEHGENLASKVTKEDVENMVDELKSTTEAFIEKNKELIEKCAPLKEDLKKVLDNVSNQAKTLLQHSDETTKQKEVNEKLFRALEDENDNITVCLRVFDGVAEDALKGLTTTYCKVYKEFTDPYDVFESEDEQVTWEAGHLKQVGEMLANIYYSKLKKQ